MVRDVESLPSLRGDAVAQSRGRDEVVAGDVFVEVQPAAERARACISGALQGVAGGPGRGGSGLPLHPS